jgi:hypothetical protein
MAVMETLYAVESARDARFEVVMVALVPVRPVRPVVAISVPEALWSFKVYEDALVIALQETVIDFKVFAVALTVGAAGVARVIVLATCPVAVEVAEADPPVFETVITTRINLPPSPLTGVYVELVAEAISL